MSNIRRRNSEEEMIGEQIQFHIAPPAPDKKDKAKVNKGTSQSYVRLPTFFMSHFYDRFLLCMTGILNGHKLCWLIGPKKRCMSVMIWIRGMEKEKSWILWSVFGWRRINLLRTLSNILSPLLLWPTLWRIWPTGQMDMQNLCQCKFSKFALRCRNKSIQGF